MLRRLRRLSVDVDVDKDADESEEEDVGDEFSGCCCRCCSRPARTGCFTSPVITPPSLSFFLYINRISFIPNYQFRYDIITGIP